MTGTIAWLAYSTARAKLNLDFFDRRFKIYKLTLKFLDDATKHDEKVEIADIQEFSRHVEEAEFIFPKRVYQHLVKIRDQAIERRKLIRQREESPRIPEVFAERAEREEKSFKWLVDQFDETKRIMEKSLKLIRR